MRGSTWEIKLEILMKNLSSPAFRRGVANLAKSTAVETLFIYGIEQYMKISIDKKTLNAIDENVKNGNAKFIYNDGTIGIGLQPRIDWGQLEKIQTEKKQQYEKHMDSLQQQDTYIKFFGGAAGY